MRKLSSMAALLFAAGSFSSALQAAVIETTYAGWDIFGTARHFEIRNGSVSTWEMAQKDGAGVLSTANLVWSNGVSKSFTLSHSSVTGDLTLNIEGTSLTWDLPEGWGWGQVSIMAKGATANGGANIYTSTISNLMLDGNAFANDTLSDSTNAKNGVKLTGQYYSDFTITGDLTFSWVGANPSTNRMEMFVGVAQAVPVPASVWLLGSALGLLAARSRFGAK